MATMMDNVQVDAPAGDVPEVPQDVENITAMLEQVHLDTAVALAHTPGAEDSTEEAASETSATSPSLPSPPLEQTPRSEKRESRLPLPGSRLPLRKSSNPSLATPENTAIPIPPPKQPRMALPTPKLQTGSLRRPSPGVSPVRSPIGSGLSPSLKSQSSSGSLRSPAAVTPTRIGLPRSPISAGGSNGQRSVSTSAVNTLRALPKPGSIAGGMQGTRRASGLPTITRTTPSTKTGTPTKTISSIPQGTPQPKRVPISTTPRTPAGKKSLAAPTSPSLSATTTIVAATPSPARTPLRVRSFQSPPKPVAAKSPTLQTPAPKPLSATPKTNGNGSIKYLKLPIKRPSLPAAATEEETEQLDKRQRALASSQALREQIKKARAARAQSVSTSNGGGGSVSSGGGGSGGGNSDWPEIVIAGVDDKKKEDEETSEGSLNSDEDRDSDDDEHPLGSEPVKTLAIRPGGILDLTSQTMQEFNEAVLGDMDPLLVKVLLLQRNSLTLLSPVIKSFRGLYTLDLSCNSLKGTDYLFSDDGNDSGAGELDFPYLKTLLIHSNLIESLEPLMKRLDAPRMNYLDVHANRLKALPKGLVKKFGSLTNLIASENRIEEVDLESVEGLQVIDLTNNSIGSLPPKLGLLADKGLRDLRVGGNLFRVPRRQVLEKGTEALLEWLRERIVVEEKVESDAEVEWKDCREGEVKEDGWDVVGRNEGSDEVD
ncbi:hypothetical protein ABW20_dc0110170 [Dactylellina cionopaga]|nr:hypothetical protein ABW20_dc0110170 [Dactylellina cionopaga]